MLAEGKLSWGQEGISGGCKEEATKGSKETFRTWGNFAITAETTKLSV